MSQSSFYSEFRKEAKMAVQQALPNLLHSAIQTTLAPFREEVARLGRENDALRTELAQVQELLKAAAQPPPSSLPPRPEPDEAEMSERRKWAAITKTIMLRNGWSQRKLGEYLGTTNQSISQWTRLLYKPGRRYQAMLLSLLDEANDSEVLRKILLEGDAEMPKAPRNGMSPKALVKAVLKHLECSHTALAEMVGVAQSTVSKWARGLAKPSPRYIEALEDLLNE